MQAVELNVESAEEFKSLFKHLKQHVSNSKLDSLIINSLNFEIREAVSEFFDRASIDGVCVWPFPNEVLDL